MYCTSVARSARVSIRSCSSNLQDGYVKRRKETLRSLVASRVIAAASSTHSPAYHIVTRHVHPSFMAIGKFSRLTICILNAINGFHLALVTREPYPGVLDSKEMRPFTVNIKYTQVMFQFIRVTSDVQTRIVFYFIFPLLLLLSWPLGFKLVLDNNLLRFASQSRLGQRAIQYSHRNTSSPEKIYRHRAENAIKRPQYRSVHPTRGRPS